MCYRDQISYSTDYHSFYASVYDYRVQALLQRWTRSTAACAQAFQGLPLYLDAIIEHDAASDSEGTVNIIVV